MKLLFAICLLLLSVCNSMAQVTVTNKDVSITNLNQDIYLNGSVVNENTGMIKNTGNIYVSGDIVNNSSTSFSDSSSGQFILNGNAQQISGTHTLSFHKLLLNSTDTLTLFQSINVIDSLNFASGMLHLNGHTIDLDSTGYLFNERNASRIFGSSGKVQAHGYMNQPGFADNMGGLGFKLSSNGNCGQIHIERGHAQQAAADSGIFRYYKVSCQYPLSPDSISLSYFADEITGTENNFKVFSKKASGSSGWLNRGGKVDFVGKEVTALPALLLDTLFFTIADQTCSAVPDINITGVSNLTALMAVDTITCAQDTLSINAYSSAPNALISWRDMADNIHSNPLQVSSPGFYYIEVTNGVNGCNNSILVNVTQDKAPPLLDPLPDSLFLNCSQSVQVLNGNSPTAQTALTWTGTSFNSPDPASVTNTGTYYLSATSAGNGCSSTDSVIIGYKPIILLVTSNDTIACKSSPVGLSASAVGSFMGLTYIWSNGAQSATTTVQPATSTTYIVTASATGCLGKDTVTVTIPPDMIDSVATYKPCNGTTVGTILLYVYGGIPPYQYSIDGGNTFSSSGNFPNTPFGTYNVLIKDSLGCTKANTAVLNGFSQLPVPQFIASTQNAEGDTIVLVDISSPQPDSVSWKLPAQASMVGGDNFNPVIYMPDTGAFAVTMTGYWADCVIDTTKIIHFHPADSLIATQYNNNGIKSVTLYPNPSNGTFTVDVEFYKKQSSSIQIWDTSPFKYYQKNYSDTDLISLPLSLGNLQNGTYILRVIGEYNTKHLNFIISH